MPKIFMGWEEALEISSKVGKSIEKLGVIANHTRCHC